jgi:hypothetical protein
MTQGLNIIHDALALTAMHAMCTTGATTLGSAPSYLIGPNPSWTAIIFDQH